MGFLKLKTTLFQSYTLFGINNKLVKPVIIPLARYATDEKQQKNLKKDKKLAKKLAAQAAEPAYFKPRFDVWTELKKKYDQELEAKDKQIIEVTLLDGKILQGYNWDFTPFEVAKSISTGLAAEVQVAKVNSVLWDLERPLEDNCDVELLKLDAPDAKAVFWTTAACTLAEALERIYGKDAGGLVCNIGSTQHGFFVDIHLEDKKINRKDVAEIEEGISKIIASPRVKVERIEVLKRDACELFSYNQFKLRTINASTGDTIPIYRVGSFIDISSTPFVRNNKKVNAIKVLQVESVAGSAEPIQRIHGTAFPSANELSNFLKKNKLI